VDQDSLPLKIIKPLAERFPDVEFVELDPSENIEDIGRDPVILDTALGIKNVVVLDDIDKIQESPKFSLHDFDLGTNLKLLRKLGRLDSVRIICVPAGLTEENVVKQVSEEIRKL